MSRVPTYGQSCYYVGVAGRPTKLDDLTAKRILNAAEAGVSRRAACEAARVHQATLCDWLARGRDGESPFAEFLERLEAAEAKAERKVVDKLMEQIESGHVPAMMFWLKCRRGWRDNEPAANEAAASGTVEEAGSVEFIESVLAAAKSRKAV